MKQQCIFNRTRLDVAVIRRRRLLLLLLLHRARHPINLDASVQYYLHTYGRAPERRGINFVTPARIVDTRHASERA